MTEDTMPPLPDFAVKSTQDYQLTMTLVERALARADVRRVTPLLGLLLIYIGDRTMQPVQLQREFQIANNIHQPVARLVELGLAMSQRVEHDKRAILITLTDKGLALCATLRADIARNYRPEAV